MTERPDRPRLGRKGNRKVRTGCITCKIRKVKCDETKPFCMRCQSSGRVCDGYAPVPPRARRTVPIIQLAEDSHLSSDDNSEGTLVALSPTARSPTVVAVSPSLSILQPTDDSSGILQRFHKRTAPRLAGFMDSFFWHELVLQLGDVEPAVLHALSAVNSIYEYCEDTGTLTNQPVQKRLMHPAYSHGLKQYNKAIGELVRHSESPTSGDESVHLVCCVLFVCVEMLARERIAAMAHFDQGLQVLAGYAVGNEEKPGPLLKADMVRETLVPIFRRLSIQAILFGREPPLLPIFTHMFNDESLRSNAPFRTMDEANDALVVILDHGLRAVNEIVGLNSQKHGVKYDPERWMLMFETIKIGRDAILGELNMWIDNFSPLAAITVATPGADPKAKLGCNTLKIQHLIAEIWVSCILETAETAFDSQLTNFATVVHLASDILYMERGFGEETQSPVFVFEMGVLACVFFTACRCRQRRIRRAALLLLQEWPRRENLWDPASMSRVAKRMIEIEDKDALDPEAPDDVWPPEWKRIHKMDAEDEVDEDGNAVMACIFHRKPCGLDGEWEVIREAI